MAAAGDRIRLAAAATGGGAAALLMQWLLRLLMERLRSRGSTALVAIQAAAQEAVIQSGKEPAHRDGPFHNRHTYIWQYMLRSFFSPGSGPAKESLSSLKRKSKHFRNPVLPRPEHNVLRPGSDPRLDNSIYVRYDPAPEDKTGAIIIVVPGGNYDEADVFCGEGQPIAQWLTGLGITAVVLQYRCVSRGHYWPCQFLDWEDCARAVADRAASWGCDPERVGVIGFSAGGHLAGYASLMAEPRIRPKLQVLVYPAIDTMTPHEGGAIDPWDENVGYPPVETSIHLLVDQVKMSPPAFLAGITTDEYCPASENTDIYEEKLKSYDVPVEYVTNDEDEHGCGLQDWWTEPCEAWLRKQGWASPAEAEEENDEM